jgi:hypothetical protein
VTTTNFKLAELQVRGSRQRRSPDVERLTPTAAGDQFDYEIVLTDPATFTEPVKMAK